MSKSGKIYQREKPMSARMAGGCEGIYGLTIRNLPANVNNPELRTSFAAWNVSKVMVCYRPRHMGWGCAFFGTPEDMEAAKKNYKNSPLISRCFVTQASEQEIRNIGYKKPLNSGNAARKIITQEESDRERREYVILEDFYKDNKADLSNISFYIIDFQHAYSLPGDAFPHVPCMNYLTGLIDNLGEVGITEYQISKGEVAFYHKLIWPGEIPAIGKQNFHYSVDNVHGLAESFFQERRKGPPKEEYKDYVTIFKEIRNFIPEYAFAVTRGKIQVDHCLSWLATQAGCQQTIQVGEMADLMNVIGRDFNRNNRTDSGNTQPKLIKEGEEVTLDAPKAFKDVKDYFVNHQGHKGEECAVHLQLPEGLRCALAEARCNSSLIRTVCDDVGLIEPAPKPVAVTPNKPQPEDTVWNQCGGGDVLTSGFTHNVVPPSYRDKPPRIFDDSIDSRQLDFFKGPQARGPPQTRGPPQPRGPPPPRVNETTHYRKPPPRQARDSETDETSSSSDDPRKSSSARPSLRGGSVPRATYTRRHGPTPHRRDYSSESDETSSSDDRRPRNSRSTHSHRANLRGGAPPRSGRAPSTQYRSSSESSYTSSSSSRSPPRRSTTRHKSQSSRRW